MADTTLNPEDYNWFRQANRRVTDTYNIGKSQNQYQQETVRNAYGRAQGNLVQQYGQAKDRLPGSFARRGMLNSGMYQKAWSDLKQQRQTAYSDLVGQRDDQLGGLNLASSQLDDTRKSATFDLQEQERNRLAAIDATLRQARGY